MPAVKTHDVYKNRFRLYPVRPVALFVTTAIGDEYQGYNGYAV